MVLFIIDVILETESDGTSEREAVSNVRGDRMSRWYGCRFYCTLAALNKQKAIHSSGLLVPINVESHSEGACSLDLTSMD